MPPSLTPEDVKLEVMSVHAEFQHMEQSDPHRLSHLNQYLCRPGAICDRYFEGNYESLTLPFLAVEEDVASFNTRGTNAQI